MKLTSVICLFLIAFLFSCCQREFHDHCTDGIQNFDETSADCGGSCSGCSPPACNDGIQNQNEHAIDCGGPCDACGGLFSGIVDFSNILIAEGVSGCILSTAVYSAHISGGLCSKDFYSILYNPQRINSIAVTFRKLFSGDCAGPDSLQFHSLFSAGSKTYAEDEEDAGVSITWYDLNGKAWKTTRGDQTGSAFRVTSSETMAPSSQYQKHRVHASFNCALHDGAGNFITLENGAMVIYFRSR
jgi:hypothetical protein